MLGRYLGPLAALSLLAGCGGDSSHAAPAGKTTPAASRPHAKEPLAAAAKRLEQALPHDDCKVLITLMLHSLQRQLAPDAPPTANECAFIRSKARGDLRGFHLTGTREFGPAGFSEGSGTNVPHGGVAGIIWLIESDGSWKSAFVALLSQPQIGVASPTADRADATARRALDALATGDCPALWQALNPASRFVLNGGDTRAKFCASVATTYRDSSTAFAQIKADGAPGLETLGRTRDFSFYGIRVNNGRYLAMVLGPQHRAIPEAQRKQHDDPSVLELLTVRQPR